MQLFIGLHTEKQEDQGLLKTVFLNGILTEEITLQDIRKVVFDNL